MSGSSDYLACSGVRSPWCSRGYPQRWVSRRSPTVLYHQGAQLAGADITGAPGVTGAPLTCTAQGWCPPLRFPRLPPTQARPRRTTSGKQRARRTTRGGRRATYPAVSDGTASR